MHKLKKIDITQELKETINVYIIHGLTLGIVFSSQIFGKIYLNPTAYGYLSILTIASLFLQALDSGISQKFLNMRIEDHNINNKMTKGISKNYLDSATKITTLYFFKPSLFIPILLITFFFVMNTPSLSINPLVNILCLILVSYTRIIENVIKNIFIGSGYTFNAYIYTFLTNILKSYGVFFILLITETSDQPLITSIFCFINLLSLTIYLVIRKFYTIKIYEINNLNISTIEILKFIGLNLSTTIFSNLDKITLIIFKPLDVEIFGNYYILSLISSIIFQIICPLAYILLPFIVFNRINVNQKSYINNKINIRPITFIFILTSFSLCTYLFICLIYVFFDLKGILKITVNFQIIASLGFIAVINIISWSITQLLLLLSYRIKIAILIQIISIILALLITYLLENYYEPINLAVFVYGIASSINLFGLLIVYYYYKTDS